MKLRTYLIVTFISFIFISCGNSISKEDVLQINGYWEIDLVETPSKQSKQYQVNTTLDFFKIGDDLKGFRKKLVANFNGKYKGSNHQNNITLVKEGSLYKILNKTTQAEWTETILEISDKHLIIENENQIKYHFKRHEKISIEFE